jgi:hypothetical protein
MTLRVLSFGRIAALLLFGLCFGVAFSATPAAAGGCGYGCGGYGYVAAPVVVQPYYYQSCSCCGCGAAYAYPSPYYGAYAAGWDGYDDAVVVAPRYWGYRARHWGGRRCC